MAGGGGGGAFFTSRNAFNTGQVRKPVVHKHAPLARARHVRMGRYVRCVMCDVCRLRAGGRPLLQGDVIRNG